MRSESQQPQERAVRQAPQVLRLDEIVALVGPEAVAAAETETDVGREIDLGLELDLAAAVVVEHRLLEAVSSRRDLRGAEEAGQVDVHDAGRPEVDADL